MTREIFENILKTIEKDYLLDKNEELSRWSNIGRTYFMLLDDMYIYNMDNIGELYQSYQSCHDYYCDSEHFGNKIYYQKLLDRDYSPCDVFYPYKYGSDIHLDISTLPIREYLVWYIQSIDKKDYDFYCFHDDYVDLDLPDDKTCLFKIIGREVPGHVFDEDIDNVTVTKLN